MMVRLVKGAYWDSRSSARTSAASTISRVHPQGDDRPELRGLRAKLLPAATDFLFATHNADGRDRSGARRPRRRSSSSGCTAWASAVCRTRQEPPDIAHRTYAPVGSHRDLLAYLVRRLLENGANSSFVALAADETVSVKTLLRRPADIIGTAEAARHPNIPLPRDLYRPQRQNSRGIEFGERRHSESLRPLPRKKPAPG